MKKKRWLLLLLIFILLGCKSNSITLNDFVDVATFNGYIVKSDKSGYEAYPNITNVYYAINRENAYVVQFLELDNDEYAHKFFSLNKNEIEESVGNNDYVKSKSTNTYELYHAETISDYLLVIRSRENIIYISSPIGYINEIEEFLSELSLEY